jgi:hypothetical protein
MKSISLAGGNRIILGFGPTKPGPMHLGLKKGPLCQRLVLEPASVYHKDHATVPDVVSLPSF